MSCAPVISLPSHCTSTGDCLHFRAFKFTSSIPDKSVLLPEAVRCCCFGSGGPALVGETFSSSAVTVPTDHGSDNELSFAISLLNTLARGKKPNQPNPNNSQVKRFPRSQRNSNKVFQNFNPCPGSPFLQKQRPLECLAKGLERWFLNNI